MTRIFARPNAALFAYERSLLRPRSWPPTTHDAPTLWARAKAMFAAMCDTVRSAALAFRHRLPRAERRDLLARLAPLETLARLLLMIEAATFLLMTPEGAKLRRETPKRLPSRAAAQPLARAMPPGWRTIAALRPRIDPRIAEREARAASEKAAARAAATEAAGARDPDDPAGWRCRFRVLGAFHPSTDKPAPRRRARGVWIASLDPAIACTPLRRAADLQAGTEPAGRILARRIEALSRILANPGPAIRRLARRLAGLPAGAIETPHLRGLPHESWWHGRPETFNACALAGPAIRALACAAALADAAPPPEPG